MKKGEGRGARRSFEKVTNVRRDILCSGVKGESYRR